MKAPRLFLFQNGGEKSMPYIPPEVVEKAREMDLLTYLKSYEPQELVHFGGNTYCTREHDSLKISNGKWCCRGSGNRRLWFCAGYLLRRNLQFSPCNHGGKRKQ